MGMQVADMLGEPPRRATSAPSEGFRGWLQNALTMDGQVVGCINVVWLHRTWVRVGPDLYWRGHGRGLGRARRSPTTRAKPIGSVSSDLDHAFKVR